MTSLPTPTPGVEAALAYVADHLGHLVDGPVTASGRFRGGQAAADAALAAFDVAGYASRRNEVHPPGRRGASGLSPWIRHGLLPLPDVWDAVAGGPPRDVAKFRDELLWQEFARHWYARLGTATAEDIRARQSAPAPTHHWDRSMVCIDEVQGELERDGWLVNQTRMWTASHWAVRHGADWRAGEDQLFASLLDGSRAANRLGWQWTSGVGSSKPYGFSRWQVAKRAPSWCRRCPHAPACPIEDWPDDADQVPVEPPAAVRRPSRTGADAGPADVERSGEPSAVWLTAESLGDADPALAAHPDLPVVFCFDEPLLARLGLSAMRLVFLVECLADLAADREVRVHLGWPAEELASQALAVTWAPVPGFGPRAGALDLVELHPWPWLVRPANGSVSSFSAWRRSVHR